MFALDPTNLGQPSQTDRAAMGVLQPHLAPFLPGDFNDDGVVNNADYTVWRDGLNDGTHNDDDFDIWRENFGLVEGAGAGAGSLASPAVPEPSSLALLVTAICALTTARRYQKLHPS